MRTASSLSAALALAVSFAFFGVSGVQSTSAAESAVPKKTIQNLEKALQGEVSASHRYELFGSRADEEGYRQVAELFRAAAKSESIHAANHKLAISELGGTVPSVSPEQVVVRSTKENLEVPIKGEKGEAERMYPRFIQQAKKDGADIAVRSFTYAKDAEAQHLKLFEAAFKDLGRNPDQDFYVQKGTGATIGVPKGSPLVRADVKDYIKIS